MAKAIEKYSEQFKDPVIPVVIEESNQVGGEIFVFMGMGTEGNGTSTTVLELAKSLSQAAKDKKVLLLDLNIVEPELEDLIFDYKKRSHLNIDQVYNLANAGKISGRDITQHSALAKGSKNLYLLTGTKLNYLADHFNVEVLRAVLQAAKQEYEYIFVDASSHFDNAATVAAIIEAAIITCVTDFSGAGLRNFAHLKKAVLEMHPDIISKVKLLGVERTKKQVTQEVVSEVLGIKVSRIIEAFDSEGYSQSLNRYLKDLELEYIEEKDKQGILEKLKSKLQFKMPNVPKVRLRKPRVKAGDSNVSSRS